MGEYYDRLNCRAKTRYVNQEAVNKAVATKNAKTDYRLMLVGYHCPHCGFYHMTRAKPGTARWKRAEKRRQAWASSRTQVRRRILAELAANPDQRRERGEERE